METVQDDIGTKFEGLSLWLELFQPFIKVHRNDDKGMCFDILCPRTIRPMQSKLWADMKADKIASYGINAVSAPETP
jgi:hypothetical protein